MTEVSDGGAGRWAGVALAPCADYLPDSAAAAVAQIAEAIPALREIRPGTRVAVKANLVAPLRPERAGTTHPALLSALTGYLTQKGASVVIGDSPGGPFARVYVDGIYAAAGLRAVQQAGAELNEDFSVRTASFPAATAAAQFDYTAWLDQADVIVNFSKLKTHGMMSMSCAVKNMFGVIPGLQKPEYHYRYPQAEQFADMLIDLNEYFRPQVNLVDAVVAMEGFGPTNGRPRHMGLLLGSESPYTLDLICAELIGLAPGAVPVLTRAIQRGLAPACAADVPVTGGSPDAFRVPDFDISAAKSDLTGFVSGRTAAGRALNRIAGRALAARPALGPVPCVACGKCASMCPAGAIRISGGRAHIDRKACIRCFCCQEFCPVGAMIPKRSAVARLLIRRKS